MTTIESRDATVQSPMRHATSRAFRGRLILTVAGVALALLVTGGIAKSQKAGWIDRPTFSATATAKR